MLARRYRASDHRNHLAQAKRSLLPLYDQIFPARALCRSRLAQSPCPAIAWNHAAAPFPSLPNQRPSPRYRHKVSRSPINVPSIFLEPPRSHINSPPPDAHSLPCRASARPIGARPRQRSLRCESGYTPLCRIVSLLPNLPSYSSELRIEPVVAARSTPALTLLPASPPPCRLPTYMLLPPTLFWAPPNPHAWTSPCRKVERSGRPSSGLSSTVA